MIRQSGTSLYGFDPKLRKYILLGQLHGTVFIKSVEPKNFMRVVNGYGIQYDAFVEFEKIGVSEIRIDEVEGAVWTSSLKDWKEHGKAADYGHGKQQFLSMKYLHYKSELQKRPVENLKPVEVEISAPQQLSLLS